MWVFGQVRARRVLNVVAWRSNQGATGQCSSANDMPVIPSVSHGPHPPSLPRGHLRNPPPNHVDLLKLTHLGPPPPRKKRMLGLRLKGLV